MGVLEKLKQAVMSRKIISGSSYMGCTVGTVPVSDKVEILRIYVSQIMHYRTIKGAALFHSRYIEPFPSSLRQGPFHLL